MDCSEVDPALHSEDWFSWSKSGVLSLGKLYLPFELYN